MGIGPKSLADNIATTISLQQKPIHLREYICTIILDNEWIIAEDEALDKAEACWARVRIYLSERLNLYNLAGRALRFSFNSSSDYLIQGICFIERGDSPELQKSKKRRLFSDQYAVFMTGLTPDQFEKLCGKIIQLLGVKHPVVTRHSADEGIDFYGQLSLESMFFPRDLTPTIQKQLKVWLVGQAKHYQKMHTSTAEIRELVGSVELGRARTFGSKISPHPKLNLKVSDPVFCLFFTTGEISINAWRLLDRSGVIAMDGEMISAFLSDRAAGISSKNPTKEEFIRWVNTG